MKIAPDEQLVSTAAVRCRIEWIKQQAEGGRMRTAEANKRTNALRARLPLDPNAPALPPAIQKGLVKQFIERHRADTSDNSPFGALADAIIAGKVEARATVYVNFRNEDGERLFTEVVDKAGAPFREDCIYMNNTPRTKTAWLLAPWTGEVFIRHEGEEIPTDLVQEIMPFVTERGSQLRKVPGGHRVYNNPLFQAALALGAWEVSQPEEVPQPS